MRLAHEQVSVQVQYGAVASAQQCIELFVRCITKCSTDPQLLNAGVTAKHRWRTLTITQRDLACL